MDLCLLLLKCVWSRAHDGIRSSDDRGTSEKESQEFGQYSGGGCIFPFMY